jgi:hypothetical protein
MHGWNDEPNLDDGEGDDAEHADREEQHARGVEVAAEELGRG